MKSASTECYIGPHQGQVELQSNALKSTEEQILRVCILLDDVSVQAQAIRDVNEVLVEHANAFVGLINDIKSINIRRNRKIRELASVLGQKIGG